MWLIFLLTNIQIQCVTKNDLTIIEEKKSTSHNYTLYLSSFNSKPTSSNDIHIMEEFSNYVQC